MVLPACIYLVINAGREGAAGWGIPMATDLAFALGVLAIAARWAPASLRPFLLTLAIVDDIGAIVVIALFYPTGGSPAALAVAVGLVLLIVGLQRIDVRAAVVYVLLGIGLWVAFFQSGVHPAIAGVILGLLTPAVPFQRPKAVSEEAHRVADETVDDPVPPDADAPQWLWLATLSREAVSPLARVEAALHPWTTSVVVPLFALANAGILLSRSALSEAVTSTVTVGVVAGLVIGKTAGITLATAAVVRTRFGRLPSGAGWRHVLGVAFVAGIGFTVSLLIADLAFSGSALEDHAKIGILVASILAGSVGYCVLRFGSADGIDRRGRIGSSSHGASAPGEETRRDG
jgi:NhaA family Na+:H+ antiporter